MFLCHLLFGFLSGFFACKFLACNNIFLFTAISAVSSSLPDIDHVSSFIGRRLQPFSVLLNFFFKHRGFLHSFTPPLVIYFIIITTSKELASAVFIGYASHLLLDSTTTQGIRPFHPLKLKIKGFIRTNSFIIRKFNHEKQVDMML